LITIEKSVDGVNERQLLRFTQQARKAIGLKGQVSLLLTSNREMRALNRCFRGKDKPTDVISFPALEAFTAKLAGDLAISVDIAVVNARELGHSTADEIRVLILHGLLHLAGYDHERDQGEMAQKESLLRSKLGLPVNLIARSQSGNKRKRKMKNRRTENARSTR
jgi:probable rRNA maturation factor